MIATGLISIGVFLYYSKSKYFPKSIISIKSNAWLNLLLILTGAGLFVIDWGWASGLLYALCIYMLALAVIQIALVSKDHLSK